MADATSDLGETLNDLFATIEARKGADPKASYTASLLAAGRARCARKFGEEAIETVIAGTQGDKTALAEEAADALYHLLVLLAANDLTPGGARSRPNPSRLRCAAASPARAPISPSKFAGSGGPRGLQARNGLTICPSTRVASLRPADQREIGAVHKDA